MWQGKHYKTYKYTKYENTLMWILPNLAIPTGKLQIDFEFGFRSEKSDIDNPVKPFLDILQKRYGFNDNKVYRITLEKKIVKSGDDYISFIIKPYYE